MAKIYSKKFKTISEQIDLLKARGVRISDEQNAKQILLKKNYFDVINGFETLLLKDAKADKKEFELGVDFDDFNELYQFDKDLSSIVFKAIDTFENQLKSSIAYRFCEKNQQENKISNPANFIDLRRYENPFSIHNRIDHLLPGNPPDDTIKEINKEITSQFVLSETRNINRKILTYNNENALPFISTKSRSRIQRTHNTLNSAIDDLNNAINSANLKINTVPASQVDGINLLTLQTIGNKLNRSVIKGSTHNKIQIEIEIKNYLQSIEELIIRVNKIYSRVSLNNNTLINNELHFELKKFINHNIFKTNYGYKRELNYIEYVKTKYKHLQTYEIPPFWVIIKTLELGSVNILMYGLTNDILDKIISDMGLQNNEKHILINSIKIITDLRNHCAHFGLVNRYRTSNKIRINADLIKKLSLNTKSNVHYEIPLYDALLVLSQFVNLGEINNLFSQFFEKDSRLTKEFIQKRFLERMGNPTLQSWCEF